MTCHFVRSIFLLYKVFVLSKLLCADFWRLSATLGKDRSHFTPRAWRIRISPMLKSLYRTARKAYWTTMLWVLHHASCTVTPPQCEHSGSAVYWLLSYGVSANIGVTSLRQSWTLAPSIGLAVELRRVTLPLPATLAPHGIAQIMFRQ
jgi:hypothetical protein